MDNFRSKSYSNGRSTPAENASNYYSTRFSDYEAAPPPPPPPPPPPHYAANPNPSGMQDLRCYSASYASSSSSAAAAAQNNGQMDIVVAGGGGGDQWKFKKGKSTNGMGSKNWSFSDPELLRKKRVASYKAYTVEGKMKGSIKKSFRWLKERYTLMVYGHR